MPTTVYAWASSSWISTTANCGFQAGQILVDDTVGQAAIDRMIGAAAASICRTADRWWRAGWKMASNVPMLTDVPGRTPDVRWDSM